MLRPWEEDQIVSNAARKMDATVTRYSVVQVDEQALPSEYFRRVPDYKKIRKALERGINVPGARQTDRIEYVIRHQDQPQPAALLAMNAAEELW